MTVTPAGRGRFVRAVVITKLTSATVIRRTRICIIAIGFAVGLMFVWGSMERLPRAIPNISSGSMKGRRYETHEGHQPEGATSRRVHRVGVRRRSRACTGAPTAAASFSAGLFAGVFAGMGNRLGG